jgi:hypothetical protein
VGVDITRNIRVDEQMGIVIPHPKLTSEGRGVLLELLSTSAEGLSQFSDLIDRHEKRMAMTVLGQFIFLGMLEVGTQALNQSSTDTFQMSIAAWADSVADVVNRFAVPRLFKLNGWRGEELPRVTHSDVGVPDLVALAEFINKLVGSQVLTPDGQLETHLREQANLPELEEELDIRTEDLRQQKGMGVKGPQPNEPEEPEVEAASDFFHLMDDEEFALRLKRGGPKWERSTNNYELALRNEYAGWADTTARQLGAADEDDWRDMLRDRVDELVLALLLLGRRNLPNAHALGLGDAASSPEGMRELADAIAQNEAYLHDSLGPGIVAKVDARLREEPLLRQDRTALAALLGTFVSRIGMYGGAFWALIMRGMGDRLRQKDKPPRVRSVLDPQAKHCPDCPRYAGEYENWDTMVAHTGGVPAGWNSQCLTQCRCWIEEEVKPGVWKRIT